LTKRHETVDAAAGKKSTKSGQQITRQKARTRHAAKRRIAKDIRSSHRKGELNERGPLSSGDHRCTIRRDSLANRRFGIDAIHRNLR